MSESPNSVASDGKALGLRRTAIVLFVLAGLLGALYLGLQLGRSLGALDNRYLASLEAIKEADEVRIAQLNRDLIDARLAYKVDSQALQSLRKGLEDSRAEMAKLQKEVTFYRSLMTPGKLSKGLQIAAFETLPLASGAHSYHLLLTQVASRRTWLTGKVKINVSGETGLGPQVLSLTEMAELPSYPLGFRFRYFQDLRGELRMPDGFSPREVEVTVERKGKKPVTRTFPWTAEV